VQGERVEAERGCPNGGFYVHARWKPEREAEEKRRREEKRREEKKRRGRRRRRGDEDRAVDQKQLEYELPALSV